MSAAATPNFKSPEATNREKTRRRSSNLVASARSSGSSFSNDVICLEVSAAEGAGVDAFRAVMVFISNHNGPVRKLFFEKEEENNNKSERKYGG